eukprot:m.307539 g.307539  ORF g.307539 m.307539 type:complete len:511 (+) comp42422_c0_seq1:128-1660(+)
MLLLKRLSLLTATGVALGVGTLALRSPNDSKKELSVKSELPVYTRAFVAGHTTPETGIWVTYKDHVYDISDFIDSHPGGRSKIILAAGKAVDPFWAVYQVHMGSPDAQELLESMKIGQLLPGDKETTSSSADDVFANEPERSPLLNVKSQKPFNAETPLSLLGDQFYTPNSIFFVRNHLPVPEVNVDAYKLRVGGMGVRNVTYTLRELRDKYAHHMISATVQCAGNRRTGLSAVKVVRGLSWGQAAIGTATWTGVRLRDVLLDAGCDVNGDAKHIEFECLDKDMTGDAYAVSIPIEKALSEDGGVLLVFEMNGKPLPPDHGYPLRVIVPGVAGARNAKWVTKIIAKASESDSFWQQEDYKVFDPSSLPETADYSRATSIQETPVQSAITEPASGTVVDPDEETVTVKGYAFSGGGRDINRVDVTIDGGLTWHRACLQQAKSEGFNKQWAWTLWEVDVDIPKGRTGSMEIACRAVDSANNTQPEKGEHVWNFRGLLNNSWHCVHVDLKGGD